MLIFFRTEVVVGVEFKLFVLFDKWGLLSACTHDSVFMHHKYEMAAPGMPLHNNISHVGGSPWVSEPRWTATLQLCLRDGSRSLGIQGRSPDLAECG